MSDETTRKNWTAKTRVEAYSMLRRVIEDWPYQPPEVIEPEQAAFRRWLEDHKPPTVDYVEAFVDA